MLLASRVIVLSGRPGRIKAEFNVDRPYPRHRDDPDLVGLRRHRFWRPWGSPHTTSRLTPALLAVGGATVIGAIAWWWITFGDVVQFGYLSWREAGGCLVQNFDICSLAKALCLGSHPRFLSPIGRASSGWA